MLLWVAMGYWAIAQIPGGFESYEQRPDILKIIPKDHPSLPKSWEALKRGHLEAVAQVLELYPEHEIYFLARDSELLYDFAKLATQNEPDYAKRIHLLNISRANMRAEQTKAYLNQEGISENALRSGKKILFVDTGFSGTIPRVIEEYYPKEFQSSFQTHLLASANENHPSTRVFLQSMNPAATEVDTASLHGSIVAYEEMPRFTDRSDRFAGVGGRWVPISESHSSSDGVVDPKRAREYQESLAHYQKSKEAKALFQKRRKIYRKLYQLKDQPELLKKELKKLLKQASSDPYQKALVIDFLETEKLHRASLNVLPQELGVTPLENSSKIGSNKNKLIKQFPQWKPILENPETMILKLLKEKDYATLGAINDLIVDHEYLKIFSHVMGKYGSGVKPEVSLVKALIKSEKADEEIAVRILSQPHWNSHPELVEALIKTGRADSEIAEYILSKPFWSNHPEWVEALIKNGNADHSLATFVLPKSHWKNHPALRKRCPYGVTLACLKLKLKEEEALFSHPCDVRQVLSSFFH